MNPFSGFEHPIREPGETKPAPESELPEKIRPEVYKDGLPDDVRLDSDVDELPNDIRSDVYEDELPDDVRSDACEDELPDDVRSDVYEDELPDDVRPDSGEDELPDDVRPDSGEDELPDDVRPDEVPDGTVENDSPEDIAGGSYQDVKKNSDGERHEVHHMPADSASDLNRDVGPAIRMDKEDHRQTASCGNSREAREYRERQKDLIADGKFREALQMDIDDIRDKFGDKYDDAIAQMLDYVDQLEEEGIING